MSPPSISSTNKALNQKFAIFLFTPSGYVHSQAFSEVAETLQEGFSNLGFNVPITSQLLDAHRHIILGSNLIFSQRDLSFEIPEDSILYNLEQIDPNSPWFNAALILHFKHLELWDYSLKNIQALENMGVKRIGWLPIAFAQRLSRISPPNIEPDIDILFYGSLGQRRESIINALRQQGLNVKVLFGVYGNERDRWIQRSKIVLNMHFYSSKVFESVRVSYLLANKKFVISELGTQDSETEYFQDGLVFSSYDDLVNTCVEWIHRSPAEREAIAQKGYELISARPIEKFLAPLIEQLPEPSGKNVLDELLRVDLGCGHRKASGYFGVDICPAPGVDRVANLTREFPFKNNSVDELRAHDVIEHLPDRLHTMNEIWRVCKPGALVDLLVPSSDGRGAFQDPTHVSFWNFNSFLYFAIDAPSYLALCQQYGFRGSFQILALKQYESPDSVIHVHAVLEAIKPPAEEQDLALFVDPISQIRDINLILFPDWGQPEAELFQAIRQVMKHLFQSDDRQKTTIFIDKSQCEESYPVQPESLIYTIVMDLILGDDLNVIENEPLIYFLSMSDYVVWDDIKPALSARLICHCDHPSIVSVLQLEGLPVLNFVV